MKSEELSSTQDAPSYWAVLPSEILYDQELPDKAKLLYAVISSLTREKGFCYASNAFFMRRLGVSDRTLQRHLRALEDHGCIAVLDGNGGASTRKIFAGVNPLANHDKNVMVPPTKMSGGGDKSVGGTPTKMSRSIIERKEKTDPPKAPQGAAWEPTMFERFWKLYPKKKDKAKAIREWDRLKADRKLMGVMSAALRAQMASEEWQRDNGRAVPYPCRWLSHRRWEDELEEPAATAETREELPWI